MLPLFGAAVVATIALVVAFGNGPPVLKAVLGLVAVGLIAMPLADMPIASTFDGEGVTRRALLRKHRIAWHDVSRVERMRVGWWRTRGNHHGGLVARVGANRRYILTDRAENGLEFDHLRRVLGTWADALGLGSGSGMRPPDDQPPTWQYRRRQWRPEGAE